LKILGYLEHMLIGLARSRVLSHDNTINLNMIKVKSILCV